MTKLLMRVAALSLLFAGASASGCSDEVAKVPSSGGPDGGGVDASAGLTCGGTECNLPDGLGVPASACCTTDDQCGLALNGSTKCLPPGQPGIASTECKDAPLPDGGGTWIGCCSAAGCGKSVPRVGCVPNAELGLAAATCTYDPTNDCQKVGTVDCDGPEDCPTGQRCCSDLAPNGPQSTGCHPSCSALAADAATATWRELCHAGDACEDPTYQCRASTRLPPWLGRCNTAAMGASVPANLDSTPGRVNCGGGVCGAGEKCCLIADRSGDDASYCAPAGTACTCHGTDGGKPQPRSDAGGAPPPEDAGPDTGSAPPPSDAGPG